MPDVRQLQAFLQAVAAPRRTVVQVPPFTLYLHPRDSLKYLNYAVPDADVEPEAAAVEDLRRAFRAHDRLPRLEWIEEFAPRLAETLAAAGMTEELRTPLMTCEPTGLVDAEAGVDDLRIATIGDADLLECSNLQRAAFGQPPLASGDDVRDPRSGGGGCVLARASDTAVAAAAWTPVAEGMSEIVGVATADPWRRRGLAGAVTAAAARQAFAAGASLCVLSPGDEGAQRVYARAGFRRVATMLHWSDTG